MGKEILFRGLECSFKQTLTLKQINYPVAQLLGSLMFALS